MPQFQVFYEDFKDDIQLLGIDIGILTGLGSHGDPDDLLRELGVRYSAGWTDDGSVHPQIRCDSHAHNGFRFLRWHHHGEERGRDRRQLPYQGVSGVAGGRIGRTQPPIKLAGFPHLVLEFFADQGVGCSALDIDCEAMEFVPNWLVADLLK